MKTPPDKSGREIKIGGYIIYGHALGRSLISPMDSYAGALKVQ